VTIMGAMTQFVPVWSGVTLHDQSLAMIQLWLVSLGLLGFGAALIGGWVALAPAFGTVMAIGFWVFVYNIGRTLLTIEGGFDVTESHFAVALGFFVLLTALGVALAIDFVWPVFDPLGVARVDVVAAHATLAVFGAILTTVLGALYQLGTMFTQTDLHGADHYLQRFEMVGYPFGVIALATGRLLGYEPLAVGGGVLVLGGLAAMSVILARRLYEAQVPWTPMLSRYVVVSVAMAAWVLLAVPAWIGRPLAIAVRFGAPGTVHLLSLGIVGFVVLGTLYHIVPFIVWVHSYSDRLGYEAVPMIDDLYDDRLATLDLGLFLAGGLLLIVADGATLPATVGGIAGFLILAGALVFGWNMIAVIRTHSPHGLDGLLVPFLSETSANQSKTADPE